MAEMRFYDTNDLNTTTIVTVDSPNTGTVSLAFDRDPKTQWVTVGYGTNTSTIFSVEFPTATVIDTIFLQNHNLKQFRVFYDSATANTFSNDINETTNSDTSNIFTFNTVTVSSVQLQVDLAQTDDTEKKVGEFYIGGLLLDFERNPHHADYKPKLDRKQVIHSMPNGGKVQYLIDDKFTAQIKWKFLTNSFKEELFAVYDTSSAFYFVPFGTTSSWDGDGYEVVWTNDWDFIYSSNNKPAGWGGKIIIEETA